MGAVITAARSDLGRLDDEEPSRGLLAVRTWLVVVALLIAATVIVGGATRLTDSGLSITEWKPILGAIPPLSEADWQTAFEKYRQIPEYLVQNRDMTLDAFKVIYWWEWTHRFLGRIIGVVFAVPFVLFLLRGWVRGWLARRLGLILALGALQGAVGWWMVTSGLVDRIDVAAYRLALHLTLACLIFAAVVATVSGFGRPAVQTPVAVRRSTWIVLALVFLQVFLGALVAGNDAGFVYTTWPSMNGAFVPDDIAHLEPLWRNFFENPATVQFLHRMGAYALLAATLANLVLAWRSGAPQPIHRAAASLCAVVVAQAIIGIVTLVHVTPIGLGLLHQAGALVVIAVATRLVVRQGRTERLV